MQRQPSIKSKHLARGMTLIEVMLAVTLIGILSALAYPKYQSWTFKAKMVEPKVFFGTFERAIEGFSQTEGRLPADLDKMGLQLPQSAFFNYAAAAKIEGGIPSRADNKEPSKSPKNQGQFRAWICHQSGGAYVSTEVANPAIYNAHLAHGDSPGFCPERVASISLVATPKAGYVPTCDTTSRFARVQGIDTAYTADLKGGCLAAR